MSATCFSHDDIRIPPKPLRITLHARPRLLAAPALRAQVPLAAFAGLMLAWACAGILQG
jgi:hypothetical protein